MVEPAKNPCNLKVATTSKSKITDLVGAGFSLRRFSKGKIPNYSDTSLTASLKKGKSEKQTKRRLRQV
jgi:hypothetical protein